jgi:NADH pyrophosphatase NudC (nudix superfamily)
MNAQMLLVMVGTGFLMMVSGIQKSLLEWRRPRRICPSCGRQLQHGRNCGCTR